MHALRFVRPDRQREHADVPQPVKPATNASVDVLQSEGIYKETYVGVPKSVTPDSDTFVDIPFPNL
jgi:hypothetical protein